MTRYYKFKVIGLALMSIPIALLFVFALGESFAGDISGLIHFAQSIPFILVAILLWNRPLLGAWITLTGATALLIVNQLRPMPGLIMTGVMLAVISSLFFMDASKYEDREKMKMAHHM